MNENMKKIFIDSIKIKEKIIDSDCLLILESMGNYITESILDGGKLMLCGNGGSAADA